MSVKGGAKHRRISSQFKAVEAKQKALHADLRDGSEHQEGSIVVLTAGGIRSSHGQ